MPTPTIDSSSHCGSWMSAKEARPRPPQQRLTRCAPRRPMRRASEGSTSAQTTANTLYTANRMPTQFAPSWKAGESGSVAPNWWRATAEVL